MSLARLMNQPLTVQTFASTSVDAYGDEAKGFGVSVDTVGYLEQLSSVEFVNGRDTTVSQWRAYLPAVTVIGRLDRISFQSQLFQVDGEPHHVYNPRTRSVSHIQCHLIVVVG